mgnify:CR=1 FL=1
MNSAKLVGILLIAAGAIALVYGSFSYTKETHNIDIGPLHMQVAEKERVNIPLWAGFGAIIIGGLLLVGRRKG